MIKKKSSVALLLAAVMAFGNVGAVSAENLQETEDFSVEDSLESAEEYGISNNDIETQQEGDEREDNTEDNRVMLSYHPELQKYVRKNGSIDYVALDRDILPELQEDDVSDQSSVSDAGDEDNNTYVFDTSSGTLTATGSNTIKYSKMCAVIAEACTGNEDTDVNNYLKKISVGKDIEGFYENLLKRRADALTEIYVEDNNNLDQIGRSAFKQNPNLKKLYVGTAKSDTKGYEISHKAFYGDTALSDVTLNNVFHVGQRAFYKDSGITKITFNVLHHMRGDAFEDCKGLEAFELKSDSNYFYTDDGILYKKYCPYYVEKDKLYNIVVPGLMRVPYKKVGETFKVKRGTKTVGFAAVAGMDQMKTAKISSGVKIVGPRAFYNAPNMKALYISKSVKHIGNEAFSIFDTTRPGSGDAPYADYDDVPYATEADYDEAFNGDYFDKVNPDNGSVSVCNVTDVYYSGSEEEWKQIRYDRYDDSANYYEDAGSVADHMESIGLSSNVVIHYNSTDPDILMPDFVESKGVIKSYSAVMTAGSKKITFDSSFYGFTPSSYTVKALENSSAKGVRISKKGILSGRKAGSYEVTLAGDGGKTATVYIFVEKPVMKKLVVKSAGSAVISQMLKGTTYLEPTKYESKKTSVATIDENGNIKILSKGTSKIIVYFGKRKYRAGITLKIKKEKQKKDKEK